MDIDLIKLHNHGVDKLDISSIYSIPDSYFGTTGIKKLENIEVNGYVYLSPSEDDITEEVDSIKCTIKGNMVLEDSISLELVEYPFSIEYDDKILNIDNLNEFVRKAGFKSLGEFKEIKIEGKNKKEKIKFIC